MRSSPHSNRLLFHANSHTKEKRNSLIIIDNETRFVLLCLFHSSSDLTPAINLMNKTWSKAVCTRQHTVIWNYICSNVKTPKHLWWKNTRLPDMQFRISPYIFNSQNQLAAFSLIESGDRSLGLPDHPTLQDVWLWRWFHWSLVLLVHDAHCPSLMQVKAEGKQQNEHTVRIVYALGGEMCPQPVLLYNWDSENASTAWTISHWNWNTCSAVHLLTFNSPFGKSLPSFIPWRLAMNSWQVIFFPMFWKGWQRNKASPSCCFWKVHKQCYRWIPSPCFHSSPRRAILRHSQDHSQASIPVWTQLEKVKCTWTPHTHLKKKSWILEDNEEGAAEVHWNVHGAFHPHVSKGSTR